MNVSVLMCEEWNLSAVGKMIVGEKRREWSAVKTQAAPDKALVFCSLHTEPDPKPG